MSSAMPDTGALSGLRVLDLTSVLAGPYCSMILADLGADVIKVEQAEGDPIRSVGRPDVDSQTFGGYFQSINRGKRSVVIDLHRPDGRGILLRLAEQADVLLENFRAGTMERLGLDFETLHDLNPRLVYGCVRGFGDPRTGPSPLADWPAYDIIAQAMCGLVDLTGETGGPPTKVGVGIGDVFPGTLLAVGVLSAVLHVRAGGVGQLVDVAMYDGLVSLCERIVHQYSATGVPPQRQGNTHPFFEPYGLYQCADGWVALAAPTDAHWSRLCAAIGDDELSADKRFHSPELRHVHAAPLRESLARWFRDRRVAEAVARLGGLVPIGPVNDAAGLYADPHLAARQMLVSLDHPGRAHPSTVAGCPIKLTATQRRIARRAPLLGEHTDEVLRQAGFTSAETRTLREKGVVA